MTKIVDEAIRLSQTEGAQPETVTEFTKLRDVIITQLMIKSLKRSMEFTEFTLAEYLDIEKRKDGDSNEEYYVIRVAKHKTAQQGT